MTAKRDKKRFLRFRTNVKECRVCLIRREPTRKARPALLFFPPRRVDFLFASCYLFFWAIPVLWKMCSSERVDPQDLPQQRKKNFAPGRGRENENEWVQIHQRKEIIRRKNVSPNIYTSPDKRGCLPPVPNKLCPVLGCFLPFIIFVATETVRAAKTEIPAATITPSQCPAVKGEV